MPRVLLVVLLAVLPALALAVVACSSEEAESDTTQAGVASTTAAMVTESQATTTATSAETTSSTTTTTAAPTTVTVELPAGVTRLDNGHFQFEGYVSEILPHPQAGRFHVVIVSAEALADEDDIPGALDEMEMSADDPRQVPYIISPAVSITVSSLGDGGEQTLKPDDFAGIWTGSPPEGGEDLVYALWSIEYDNDSMIRSFTEVVP